MITRWLDVHLLVVDSPSSTPPHATARWVPPWPWQLSQSGNSRRGLVGRNTVTESQTAWEKSLVALKWRTLKDWLVQKDCFLQNWRSTRINESMSCECICHGIHRRFPTCCFNSGMMASLQGDWLALRPLRQLEVWPPQRIASERIPHWRHQPEELTQQPIVQICASPGLHINMSGEYVNVETEQGWSRGMDLETESATWSNCTAEICGLNICWT